MIYDLYIKLKKLNVSVREVDGRLDIRAAKGVLNDQLLAEIKQHKDDLITLINSYRKKKNIHHSIPVTEARPSYPLSSAQRRLWVICQFAEANIAYTTPGVFIFEGDPDYPALEYALRKLLERHEILRTVFKEDEQGEVRQFIYPPEETVPDLTCPDIRNEKEHTLNSLLEEAFSKPFDLSTGPLLRNVLYRLADHTWIFTYAIHHIICDGLSMENLIKELFLLYNAHIHGEDAILEPLRIQYRDYAAWQLGRLGEEELQSHRGYWLEQFKGELPVLNLPADHPRPLIRTYRGGLVKRTIGKGMNNKIRSVCQENAATLFMGLLAAVNILLYRYTSQTDIIIGSQISGREHIDLEDQIGLYLNTLALRARFKGTDSYKDLLEIIKKLTLGAYEHQAYPFDELVEALDLRRDMSRNVLFDVSVVLQNTEINDTPVRDMGGVKVSAYEGRESLVSKFDLAFDFTEIEGELRVTLIYNSDIYSGRTAAQLAGHLENLLERIIQYPDKSIDELELLREDERRLQLIGFNDTAVDYPGDKTIPELFAEQARRTPGKEAVLFSGIVLTYKELDESTDRLAGYLRTTYAIRPDDLIGIMLDRSERTIIAILAILKAGGAYVPIDPEYPGPRKDFIFRDTGIKLLITQTDFMYDLGQYDGAVFAIDVQLDTIEDVAAPPALINRPGDLAYVMYTSGSTGMPKGVMIPHAGVVRLVRSANYVTLTGEETLLSTGAVSFDATSFEYWSMLLNGGRLVMCRQEVLLDAVQLGGEIQRKAVDMMWFTAGWLHQLIDSHIEVFKGLRTILAGGDRLSPDHINALSAQYPHLHIINGYGPTENTTFSLACRLETTLQRIPIGQPISNSTAYIIGHKGQLLPMGAVGEICVGGPGLARGYLNNPALTAERFVPNPYKWPERMYRTGDLGRWLPGGSMEFLGRTDDQVKIRGYRVELGEIENVLKELEYIEDAAVVARKTEKGDTTLIAYIVSRKELDISMLSNSLAEYLPEYMIPAFFVPVDLLPLTENGKVDRKALPDPGMAEMPRGTEYIAPANDTETQLVRIWEKVLGKEPIGVRDSFFESGGDSIKILQMVSEVRKEMDLKIPITSVYQHTTIEGILSHVLKNISEMGRRNRH